ncbi:APL1 (YJR005W) [Zygosaccharomyces parabailii]|nr:APL1 (YJR005W) [Zygosaccharomyces parabailii]CDH14736.1 probable AP-2 complex subunit beta [Zygosaccharomyces bailii ISA1307]
MSDQRIFARYKASEIKAELQNFDVKKSRISATKRKVALRKIIANLKMGNYNEMALLFPEVLRFWKVEDDMEVKRICHEYVRALGAVKPQNAKDALSAVLDDLDSRNEEIQIMALTTLAAVTSLEYVNELFKAVCFIIARRSVAPNVLKTAILLLKQMDEVDHDRVSSILDSLYDIFDRQLASPTVQVAALHTLYSIHEKSSDLKPLRLPLETAMVMLDLLPKLNEWDKAMVLESLTIAAVPQTHSDVYGMIDLVLPQLQHANTYVALNAFKFIAYLLNYAEHVNEGLIKRFSNSIVSLLNKPPELEFLVLRNVILLLLSRGSPLLKLDVPYFFIEYNDPIYIKDTKLECLYLSADRETLPRILEELVQYATDIDIQMSRKAIRAIGNLAVKLDEESAYDCVNALLDLLEFGVDYVVQEIISVFRNILRKHSKRFESSVRELVKYTESVQEPESKNAMIWIITNYSYSLPNYLEYFQIFSSNLLEETLDVQFSILNSSVKFFVRDPNHETESLCMHSLKVCTEDINNPDLRDRAFMYWRLLSLAQSSKNNFLSDVSLKSLIDGTLPAIQLNTKLDPMVLEELELNIGSIASIYLKPVSQIFKNYRPKHLLASPILNQNKESLRIVNDSVPSLNFDAFDSVPEWETIDNSERSSTSSRKAKTMMNDYDKPAEKVNQLKGKRKSSSNSPSLTRKPSMLVRKLSMKKPF